MEGLGEVVKRIPDKKLCPDKKKSSNDDPIGGTAHYTPGGNQNQKICSSPA
jgi:hypothetical protein